MVAGSKVDDRGNGVSVTAGDATITIGGTSTAPTVSVGTLNYSNSYNYKCTPEYYGVGYGGVANDWGAAITAAIAYASSNSQTCVWLQARGYHIYTSITWPAGSKVTLRGQGAGQTAIIRYADVVAVDVSGTSSARQYDRDLYDLQIADYALSSGYLSPAYQNNYTARCNTYNVNWYDCQSTAMFSQQTWDSKHINATFTNCGSLTSVSCTTDGSNVITPSAMTGLVVGAVVYGTSNSGVTVVTAVGATTVTLSQNVTAGSPTLTFAAFDISLYSTTADGGNATNNIYLINTNFDTPVGGSISAYGASSAPLDYIKLVNTKTEQSTPSFTINGTQMFSFCNIYTLQSDNLDINYFPNGGVSSALSPVDLVTISNCVGVQLGKIEYGVGALVSGLVNSVIKFDGSTANNGVSWTDLVGNSSAWSSAYGNSVVSWVGTNRNASPGPIHFGSSSTATVPTYSGAPTDYAPTALPISTNTALIADSQFKTIPLDGSLDVETARTNLAFRSGGSWWELDPTAPSATNPWASVDGLQVNDQFAQNTIAAGGLNWYTADAGTLSNLTWSANSVTLTEAASTALRYTRSALPFQNGTATAKVTTAASGFGSYSVRLGTSNTNYIEIAITGQYTGYIRSNPNGGGLTNHVTISSTFTTSTSYWLQIGIVDNKVTWGVYSGDPYSGGSVVVSGTYILTTTEAAALGQGIAKSWGFYFISTTSSPTLSQLRFVPTASPRGTTNGNVDAASVGYGYKTAEDFTTAVNTSTTLSTTGSTLVTTGVAGIPATSGVLYLLHSGTYYAVSYGGVSGNSLIGCTIPSGSVTVSVSDPISTYQAKQGTVTLVSGAATVHNVNVTATSRIFLTAQSLGTVTAPKALAVTARTAGTSFTITSADSTDTSMIAYEIFEVG